MRLTPDESIILTQAIEMLLVNCDDEKMKIMLNNIVDKIKVDEEYRLPSLISKQKKKRCINLIKAGSAVIKEFSEFAGDMGMIVEYDRLKKEVAVIQDQIGDIEGQLRAAGEVVKKELDIITDRIKEDLIASEVVKSNAEAERKARIDPRYEVALGDYKEMLEFIFTTRNKFNTIDSVHDDLRQSVSTGRNSIIKEGYNS